MAFAPLAHPSRLNAALAEATNALRAGQFERVAALLAPWAGSEDVHPGVLQLLSIASAQLARWEQAQIYQQRLLDRFPGDVAGWVQLANIQVTMGQVTQAQESLDRAQQLAPEQPAVHFNRGNLLMQQGRYEDAVHSFQRAAELAPDRPDPLCNKASALNALRRHEEARDVLRTVLAAHPGLAAGWNLLGVSLQKLGNDREALDCYLRAQQLDARLVDAFSNAAQVLTRLRRFEEALNMLQRGLDIDATSVPALRTLVATLTLFKRDEDAHLWLERGLQLAPEDPVLLASQFDLDLNSCDWTAVRAGLARLLRVWEQGGDELPGPWRLLACDMDGKTLRAFTESSAERHFGHLRRVRPEKRVGDRPQRLRVGYFSSDLRTHPVGVLSVGMLELHDKTRFETVAFCSASLTKEVEDPVRSRLRKAFDRFECVADLDDAALAQRARDLDLHLAVDLNGWTQDGRLGVFARGVAPVQMHYLGYAGTLGSSQAFEYLLADRVMVPDNEARALYSEKIITLPDSFMPNDARRAIAPETPSRQEMGLPADAFVFCCFNSHYKISHEVFGLWMELLQRRPASVLWLQKASERVVRNLRSAAADKGIAPERLVFAQYETADRHLARHACADLFLDTWPYNAHTTACDALWAGLPVLTCAGETFSSRVGASLLSACGLPELITHSPRDYLDKALELSSQAAMLQSLRRQLQDTRQQVPLFDTERFTRHIEQAYDMAWDRYRQGLAPEHFSVPPRS